MEGELHLSGIDTAAESVKPDARKQSGPDRKRGRGKSELRRLNPAEAAYPPQRLIHELFEEQVSCSPHAIAIEHAGHRVTYADLNRQANQLARYLINHGVAPDQPVAICVGRGPEMVVGLLAILKAGGAYLPLDPNYPAERLRQMVEDAAPRLILTQQDLIPLLPVRQAQVIPLDVRLKEIAARIAENLSAVELGLDAGHLLYVIYTSGSTGRPKGTAMPHRPMVNLIEWHRRTLPLTEGERVLQFAALSFDVAFQEIFSTLCMGGTLVLLNEWIRRDARALLDFVNDESIERIFVPPLVLQSLAECAKATSIVPRCCRDVITAGEQLRISPEISALFSRLSGCRLHNHYGPTETHVVTALTLSGDPWTWPSLPSIGAPIANTQIRVLDEERRPVPVGAPGEIYIGGAPVARGYLGRPELTAQRFVTDPFAASAVARLYRTGDLGRWRADGALDYLGRNDDQVKIRGFRIEPVEIEVQLALHPQVKEAAVIAREDVPGERRLVAYITARQLPPGVDDLRAHLQGALPEHMIPSAFVTLASLPLTPSGKLDRRSLPAPDLASYTSRKYELPQGSQEEAVAEVWRTLLHIDRLGRQHNFFELGGDSLLIVQMLERLRQAGWSGDARSVYLHPTVADFARTLQGELREVATSPAVLIPSGCDSISPQMLPLVQLSEEHIARIVAAVPAGARNVQDIYPLAPLQEGILFHHLLNAQTADIYVLPILLRLSSRETLGGMIRALQHVIARHDVLRTAILWDGLPRPVQVVQRSAELRVQELSPGAGRDALAQMKERMSVGQHRLDLRQAPLMSLEVMPDVNRDCLYALLKLHHLACDHESLEVMLAEVMALMEGRADQLPKPAPYRNHIAQVLAQSRTADAQAFFSSKLRDIDESTAPFGLLDVQGDSRRIEEASQEMDPPLAARVRAQARRLGTTPATIFHAAWALVVARTSGRDDVVFGSLLSGRLQGSAGGQRTLGMFINTLPIRINLRDLTAADIVEHTRLELLELLSYEQASLATAQRCSGIAGSAPLFTTLINCLHSAPTPEPDAITQGFEVLELREWTNYPVSLTVDDRGRKFLVMAQTDRSIDPRRVTRYLMTAVQSLVDALEQRSPALALALAVLPANEHKEVTERFNDTTTPFPADLLIHEIFEQQVRLRPHAVAAIYEQTVLTYEELNTRANRLASYLMEQGVTIGEHIPLLMPRCLELIVAQLAVLKCGAAYLPVDPTLPEGRQAFMLQDCGARRILAVPTMIAPLGGEGLQWIDCTQAAGPATELSAGDVRIQASPATAAYLMYTSGSTGLPKGVIVPHLGVNRLVINNECARVEPADCVAHCSNPAFDASTFEVWSALLNGARLLIVPQSVALESERLGALLRREGVTVLFQTTALFNQRAMEAPDIFVGLRCLLFGGEVCDPSAVRNLLQQAPPQQLLHVYGPTETTTLATWHVTASVAEDATTVPIGRPISNTQVYILDSRLEPVPVGVTGEIYIGGPGVALGYMDRPQLTAERFVADPFSEIPRARLYKSGDLGKWTADGNIEFLGRYDQQVKVRGFRIEPGEIEAQLVRHPQVQEAVVVARENAAREKRLVAYLTRRHKSDPEAESLRAHLKAVLPEYMIPSAFVCLSRLPLTPNGKIDRGALPAPELDAYATRSYEAPCGELEQILADIWQGLLGLERVGREDNFFDLGGHSLIATRVISRVRELLSVELPVKAIFDHPALKDLALRAEAERAAQGAEEALWLGNRVQVLRRDIDEMQDEAVLARLAEFERDLGKAATLN